MSPSLIADYLRDWLIPTTLLFGHSAAVALAAVSRATQTRLTRASAHLSVAAMASFLANLLISLGLIQVLLVQGEVPYRSIRVTYLLVLVGGMFSVGGFVSLVSDYARVLGICAVAAFLAAAALISYEVLPPALLAAEGAALLDGR